MKIKCFEKWSKFQHGIGYWLGAVQATNHCLNQCWHSSSTHIYVSRRDWIEYYATSWWLPGLSLKALKLAFSASSDEGVLATYWSHQSDNRLVLASPRPIRAHLSSHGNVGFVFCCYSPPFTGHTICARKVQLCTQRHNNDSEHDISMD